MKDGDADFVRVGPALALVRGPNVGQTVTIATVNPKEVRGIEGIGQRCIQHELGLQIVQQVVP